jgi:DNA-binding MarR family transcriptional regulator
MTPPSDRIAEGIARWAEVRPDLDARGTEVVGRVLRLGALFGEALAGALAPHGLQPGEYSVLAILVSRGHPEGELTPSALAEATYLSSGGIANLVRRLEAAGLVTRRPDPADGRGVLVAITPEGRARVDAAVTDVAAAERRLVAGLGARDRETLARGLSRLLSTVDPPSPPRRGGRRGISPR